MSAARWPFGPRATICVSLAETDVPRLRARLEILDGADLVEIRLDSLADSGAADAGASAAGAAAPAALGADLFAQFIETSPLPVGFTLRPEWQGGRWSGDEQQRRRLLGEAAAAGAAFVDVELDAAWAADFIARSPCPVIASHHWDSSTPPDLHDKLARAEQLAPAMIKLVATAEHAADALPLLRTADELQRKGQAATCFCMGEAGRASRLLALRHGDALIYAAADAGSEVAAGQWTLEALRDELRVPAWQPGSGFCGLVGHPIGHSLSPTVFNAAFERFGDALAYVPVAGDDFDDVLALVEGVGFLGVSVTMPFKHAAAARARRRDPVTGATGAANTLVFDDDGPLAYNTDGDAVVASIAARRRVSGAAVAIVGAGGAARAAAVALVGSGARVTVFNRTGARAAKVAKLAGCRSAALEALETDRFDVVVNATPVGMQGTETAGETPFPAAWLGGNELVFDMIYRPPVTRLLRASAECGCQTIPGLEMFVRQAAAQYRLLTGNRDVEPLDTMRAAAEAVLMKDSSGEKSSAHANRMRCSGTRQLKASPPTPSERGDFHE